ncbi:MAG: DUF1992 domain-containing protein [Mycobacteriales bacterium]
MNEVVRRTAGEGATMTQRKPAGMSFDDWIERQIRMAQERGDFDNLPGAGKPIPDIGRQQTTEAWLAKLAKRERLEVSALLPPSLALAKELEDLPDRLSRERSESIVRGIVLEVNERIRQAHLRPQVGPPMRAMPVNVDAVVCAWRDTRERERARRRAAQAAAAVADPPRERPRRWLRRPARAFRRRSDAGDSA